MQITRAGTRTVNPGPADYFTGSVSVEPMIKTEPPARVGGALVAFQPGARTAWHTHPLGQTIIVTEGVGWAQLEGGTVEEIRQGDVVWFPPGIKHWHGASPASAMSHIAIAEALDGNAVEWLEKVSEDQYRR